MIITSFKVTWTLKKRGDDTFKRKRRTFNTKDTFHPRISLH